MALETPLQPTVWPRPGSSATVFQVCEAVCLLGGMHYHQ